MGSKGLVHLFCIVVTLVSVCLVQLKAEDAYKYFTWTVTYGTLSPLGTPQKVILINGQFPGPQLDLVTNDNVVLNLINKLDEPFLLTWNGIKQRKNSWQDGVLGTNCPIPPNSNYTYKFQAKDQIGTYSYFPSTHLHKAAGGFGGLNVYHRSVIPVPYPYPDGDFTLLIADWYKTGHKALQQSLDSGKSLSFPDGLLINGQAHTTLNGDQGMFFALTNVETFKHVCTNQHYCLCSISGKTYMFRISNMGLSTSINFRIQGHSLKLVEIEGSHTIQNMYDSLDVHAGQSFSVLVTLNQSPKDYYIVASTRFSRKVLTATALLHYSNSHSPASGPLPSPPAYHYHWSVRQARSFRWNLTANAARPNPQGSYHYGKITPTKTIVLANSAAMINGKKRYAVNKVSYVNPDTPLKLADYFNIPGIFSVDSIQSLPSNGPASAQIATSVIPNSLHDFIEVVFQNNENTMQSWHLEGYDFWVVGYGFGEWTPAKRRSYNLVDAVTRHTAQVYPNGWTTILVSLDNEGMWNLRSAIWERQYLGQQLYLRVWTAQKSLSTEYNIPANVLLCGKVNGHHHP
ncbi:L-ascorbate oxidase homolog isoform X1 [Arachis stenosperma]|uniref:L-ascorbate oxidase homolog isoform X1 n=1 Tax=Arachis stenosperma TaxID=217475 RepID=UPI0025ACAE1F|nr:L-ascorbate oxidase homolog isoform X1 [Arachis stenosperma]XP_057730264.1 L-ascorbate oxidase homolog isoform X1 [Arachis stenosperma]